MSEGLKKPAKLGDVIRTQLSVFSGSRILRVKLETQDSVDFANEELIAKGIWHVEREGEPLAGTPCHGQREEAGVNHNAEGADVYVLKLKTGEGVALDGPGRVVILASDERDRVKLGIESQYRARRIRAASVKIEHEAIAKTDNSEGP